MIVVLALLALLPARVAVLRARVAVLQASREQRLYHLGGLLGQSMLRNAGVSFQNEVSEKKTYHFYYFAYHFGLFERVPYT